MIILSPVLIGPVIILWVLPHDKAILLSFDRIVVVLACSSICWGDSFTSKLLSMSALGSGTGFVYGTCSAMYMEVALPSFTFLQPCHFLLTFSFLSFRTEQNGGRQSARYSSDQGLPSTRVSAGVLLSSRVDIPVSASPPCVRPGKPGLGGAKLEKVVFRKPTQAFCVEYKKEYHTL